MRGHGISLWVFNLISHSFAVLTCEISTWTWREISYPEESMIFQSYRSTSKYFLRDYVTIAMVVFWWLLFSENKMLFSCYFRMWNNIYFHLWKYHVHPRKLTWCFTGVYIINSIYLSKQWSHLCTIIYGKYSESKTYVNSLEHTFKRTKMMNYRCHFN